MVNLPTITKNGDVLINPDLVSDVEIFEAEDGKLYIRCKVGNTTHIFNHSAGLEAWFADSKISIKKIDSFYVPRGKFETKEVPNLPEKYKKKPSPKP